MKKAFHGKKVLSLFWGIVLCLFLCSCAFRQDLMLNEKDSGKTLRLRSGDTVTVQLVSNPSTGFQWRFASPHYDESVIILRGDRYISRSEALAEGTPGKRSLTFVAQGAGRTGLRLIYVRPWEKNTAPAREFNLLFIVKDGTEEEGGIYRSDSRRNYKGEEVPRLRRRSLYRGK